MLSLESLENISRSRSPSPSDMVRMPTMWPFSNVTTFGRLFSDPPNAAAAEGGVTLSPIFSERARSLVVTLLRVRRLGPPRPPDGYAPRSRSPDVTPLEYPGPGTSDALSGAQPLSSCAPGHRRACSTSPRLPASPRPRSPSPEGRCPAQTHHCVRLPW